MLKTALDRPERIKDRRGKGLSSTCSISYGIVDGQTQPCWSIIDPYSLCTTAFGYKDIKNESAVSQFISSMCGIGYVLLDTSTGYHERSNPELSAMYESRDCCLHFYHTPQFSPQLERNVQVTPSISREEAMAVRKVSNPIPQVSYNAAHKIQYTVTPVSKSSRGTPVVLSSSRQIVSHILKQQSKPLSGEVSRIYQEFVDSLGTSTVAQGGRWPLAGQTYYIIKCFIPANENA